MMVGLSARTTCLVAKQLAKPLGLSTNTTAKTGIFLACRRQLTSHSSVDTCLVYAEQAPPGYDASAVVYPHMISTQEEATLLADLKEIFRRCVVVSLCVMPWMVTRSYISLTPFCDASKCSTDRRRYERGHWDAVIIKYKETELFDEAVQLSATSRDVLQRMRQHLQVHVSPQVTWLPSHAIELHPEGELRAHIDSVRFSGGLVAGLSLGTASIMRLQPPQGDYQQEQTPDPTLDNAGFVDLLLPPRSLYALTGCSRYDYTHELLADQSIFAGTGELVRRNEHRWSIIFRDAKPQDD